VKVQVFHLFFKADAAGELVPVDDFQSELHALAAQYATEHMLTPVDFKACKESWVACEVNAEGKPLRALGLLCMVLRPDFVVCRFTDNAAVVKLVQRANDYLHDVYAARGTEALVYISNKETEEQKMCPDYLDWMKLFDLKPADRWVITVH
jgi:hypothetical protein